MSARRPSSPRSVTVLLLPALLPFLLGATFSAAELTKSAERVFRGRCVSARPVTVDFDGRPLQATEYVFEVGEYIKGTGPGRLVFRQAGTPERDVTDLGRVAGLTVFARTLEYVVFLRPVSRLGLTSAAGRGNGVFLVTGEGVQAASPDGRTAAPGAETIPYEALRRAIRQVLKETR